MTRYDAIRRQLGDIEKHHERELAKHEMQVKLLCDYRDELEDHLGIAVAMIAKAGDCSEVEAMLVIASEYELRQSRKAVAT